MFWKLNENTFNEFSNTSAAQVISKYNQDYVKVIFLFCLQCLNYNTELKTLFTGGYDGYITYFKVDEYISKGMITFDTDNYLFKTPNQQSIFSIDSDKTGKFLLASIYQNVKLIVIQANSWF